MKIRLLNKKAEREIYNLARIKYDKIEVFPGEGGFTGRCQHVAAHHATKNADKSIAVVLYANKGSQELFLHVINYCNKKKKYVDNSLGHWTGQFDYYLVKTVSEDFFSINELYRQIFLNIRKDLSFLTRLLSTNEL